MRRAFTLAPAAASAMLASLTGAAFAAPGDGGLIAPEAQTLPQRIRTPDGWSPVIAVQPDDGRFIVPDFQTLPPGVRIEGIRPGMLFRAPPERILAAPVITLNGGRVAADDPEALAEFYKHAFGLYEVERRAAAGILEIVLGAGDAAAAGIDRDSGLVIVPRGAGDAADSAHIVLDVSNAALVAADAAGAGGVLLQAAEEDGDAIIALVADPAGNRIELVQQPAAAHPARG